MTSLSIITDAIYTIRNPLQTSQLADLDLDGCNVPWDHLHNLRSLSLSRTDGPSLAQLVQILRSSPQLESLDLVYVETPSEDLSSQAVVANPINLPQLSTVNIRHVPFSLVSGLVEGIVPLNAYSTFSINVSIEEDTDIDLSGFFRQAGRLCIPAVGEVFHPQLLMWLDDLTIRTTSNRSVCICNLNRNRQEGESSLSRRAQLARSFFESGRRVFSEAPISRAFLQADSDSAETEGLAILHEIFPQTIELGVTWA